MKRRMLLRRRDGIRQHYHVGRHNRKIRVKVKKGPAGVTKMVPDKGQPGRTPKEKRFLKIGRLKGQLGEGYTKLSEEKRHAKLRGLDRKKNISSANVWHHLQGLANVTTDKESEKVFRKDAEWVMDNLMNEKEKLAMTAPARAAK